MKAGLIFIGVFSLALFLTPLMALWYNESETVPAQVHSPAMTSPAVTVPSGRGSSEPGRPQPPEPPPELPRFGEFSEHGVLSFRILDKSTGRVNEVSVRDFVRGAVVSEMPATFHTEALKAQAVAAHTWALNNHLRQRRSPDPALRGADFAADPSRREGYMTERQAMDFLGPHAQMYWEKITSASDSVLEFIMEHDGQPILAAYHAISAGVTEDSGNVWMQSRPYLQPVQSEGCFLAPNFEVETSFTQARAQNLLRAEHPGIDLSAPPGEWFNVISRSDSGYVTEARVGGLTLHGRDIRAAFGLRSHNFDIRWDGGNFVFTARGHGHGVGLPQYGADFLARQGYTFDEILDRYYSDIVIRRVNFDILR
jgi:stage II sporulation protein D